MTGRPAEETARQTAVTPTTHLPTSPGPVAEPGEEGLVSVQVWDVPVRLMHWTLVLSVIVLTVTGIYIAHPFLARAPGPATGYAMGWMRAVHLTFGWIFTAVLLARIVWAFRGNRWARWDQIIPLHRHRRALLRPSLGYYFFRRIQPPPVIGHNPLAGLAYLALFLMFGLQALTGFALEALHDPEGTMAVLTRWVFTIATIPQVRLVHTLIMWFTAAFVVHHVYSAWLFDREERSGELSSIVTGWKSLPASRIRTAPELDERGTHRRKRT